MRLTISTVKSKLVASSISLALSQPTLANSCFIERCGRLDSVRLGGVMPTISFNLSGGPLPLATAGIGLPYGGDEGAGTAIIGATSTLLAFDVNRPG